MFRPFDVDSGRLAAYQYLADLVAQRRVLELGCGSGYGLGLLAGLGARLVVGLDQDVAAARKVVGPDRRDLRLATWQPPELPQPARSVDLAIVTDGSLLASHPVLGAELVRVLAPGGQLVVWSLSADHPQSRSGLSYGELLDLTEPLFDEVRVIGQSPFVGYSLAELTESAAEPDVLLDGGLLDGAVEEVVAYVLLCGATDDEPLPYGVIPQLSDTAEPETTEEAAPDAEPRAVVEAAPAPEPEAEAAPAPDDLRAYTDQAGGRLARWRWPGS